jgi:dihydroorotate dehydrogenase
MYWRIKKIGPKDIMKQYGIHAALAISLLFNVFALIKIGSGRPITKEQNLQFDQFARKVTQNLLDATYITYEESIAHLLTQVQQSEIQKLRANEILPRTADEAKAQLRQLRDIKMVTAVRIESVNVSSPNSQGLIPVEVKGQFVKHSAEGLDGPRDFCFRYLIGQKGTTQELGVASIQEIPVGSQTTQ